MMFLKLTSLKSYIKCFKLRLRCSRSAQKLPKWLSKLLSRSMSTSGRWPQVMSCLVNTLGSNNCEEEKEELEEMSWEDKPLHGTYHRPVMANQTEIVVVDKHQKRAVVIDITFPSGSDIQTNERERLEKYQRAERRAGEDVESEGNTWDCEGGRTQFLQLFSSPLTAQSKIHPEQDSGFSILLRVLWRAARELNQQSSDYRTSPTGCLLSSSLNTNRKSQDLNVSFSHMVLSVKSSQGIQHNTNRYKCMYVWLTFLIVISYLY